MIRNQDLTASALKYAFIKRFSAEKVLYNVRTIARIRNVLGWALIMSSYRPVACQRQGMQYVIIADDVITGGSLIH